MITNFIIQGVGCSGCTYRPTHRPPVPQWRYRSRTNRHSHRKFNASHLVFPCSSDSLVYEQTHNLALTAPIADFVVSLSGDGRIRSTGSLKGALTADQTLSDAVQLDMKEVHQAEQGNNHESKMDDVQSAGGKLIIEEEMAEGHVAWSARECLLSTVFQVRNLRAYHYFSRTVKLLLGGTSSSRFGAVVFWASVLLVMLASRVVTVLETWVLALWARQYEYGAVPPAITLQ